MLQLQPIEPGSVYLFYIEVIVVVVEVVYDLDPERIGIPKGAIVYLFDVQVAVHPALTFGLENRIDLLKTLMDMACIGRVVKGCFPKGVLSILIVYGYRRRKVQ